MGRAHLQSLIIAIDNVLHIFYVYIPNRLISSYENGGLET